MTTENSNTERLILDEVNQLHEALDLGHCKQFLMHCYDNALLSPEFSKNSDSSHALFFTFRHIYNFLLKLDMYKSPELNGVNTF